MIRFSEDFLRDRIYACWIGKNIGGTMGTPYEGRRELNDIHGFASKPGEPLPNDDLDLQLVWLRAVNDLGPEHINSKTLGEYWVSWITPHWNEYGICKANMRDGILPPMSGEYDNERWHHSNGAWIRTEIWASLYPAMPEKALRLAFEDASVDHGYAEGTNAAIFVAAMESAAFVIHDADALLDIGLSKIPEDCRVARAVRLVRKAYADGVDWKTCRQMVVEDSADLGWFQAPANVAFTVLGFLYGKGDFKQSLILAINCGDDTDCTGATLGSLLGIMGGMAAIPEDWRAYIGDEIKSICVTNGHGRFPLSCTELTDCVLNLLPTTLRQDHQALFAGEQPQVQLADVTDFGGVTPEQFFGRSFVEELALRTRYSYTIEGTLADALVCFDEKPDILPGGAVTGTIRLLPNPAFPEKKHFRINACAPAGWSVDIKKNLYTTPEVVLDNEYAAARFTVTAGDDVQPVNTVILHITCAGRPTSLLVPIQIMG